MRNGIVLVGMAFAVTLAVVVANRLSEQALAVAVGALCGIAASVPVSIAFVIAASRNWGRPETVVQASARRLDSEPPRYPQPQQPVIVIAPPQPNSAAYPFSNGSYYIPPQPNEPESGREFKIIGDE